MTIYRPLFQFLKSFELEETTKTLITVLIIKINLLVCKWSLKGEWKRSVYWGNERNAIEIAEAIEAIEEAVLPSNWQGIGSVIVTHSGTSNSLRAHGL